MIEAKFKNRMFAQKFKIKNIKMSYYNSELLKKLIPGHSSL